MVNSRILDILKGKSLSNKSIIFNLLNILIFPFPLQEISTLVLAVETENKAITPINLAGLVICLTGVVCHVLHKSYRQYRQLNQGGGGDSMKPLLLEENSARFLLTSSDENSEDETEVG